MKRILIFSLIVNFLLLALAAWHKSHEVVLPAREIRRETQSDEGAQRRRRTQGIARTKTATPWSKIESQDVRQFVANLRAVGCPEATIRDIVTLRICRSYRERLLDFEIDSVRRLSDTQNLDPAEWKKLREQNQDLRDEMHSELESALGEDWATLSSGLTGFPTEGDGVTKTLSADKRAQLRKINQQFRHEMEELQQKQMLGTLEPEEAATLRTLEHQKRDALAAVLSPSELETYLYRNSSAADYVRRNLPEAKSEAEYLTMVKLALEMDMSQTLDSPQARYGLNTGTDESDLENKKRNEEYAQRLKELLGEDRIAEQQAAEKLRADAEAKAREEQNRQRMQQELTAMAAEVGVNAESASRFFDRLKESQPILEKKFAELERSLTGTPEEKQKQMEAAVKAELNALAIETMGDQGPAVVEKVFKSKK
jgi:hypothetical protein